MIQLLESVMALASVAMGSDLISYCIQEKTDGLSQYNCEP